MPVVKPTGMIPAGEIVLNGCRIMQTATIVTRGHDQSVQLPEGFQIDTTEVYVKRIGRTVLLIPKDADPWELMADSLERFTGDFMHDRGQPGEQQREAMFE